MTRPRVQSGRRRRVEVAVHIVLLVAALFWLPFGTRDAGGVSNVLPALHPLPPVPAPAAEGRSSIPTDPDRPVVVHQAVARPRPVADVAPLVAILSTVATVAAAVVLSTRRRRSTSGLAVGWHPHAPSRAPPFAV